MNLDVSIHRMAVRETESLGVAQLLVVKKRQELELKLLRQQVREGSATTGADVESALRDMDAQSRRSTGRLDKTA